MKRIASYQVTQMGCGRDHVLALLSSGKMLAWDGIGSGRILDSSPDICTTPTATTNPNQYYPFQSANAITQTVPLDSVEEWTVYNMNAVGHPFHIHVNPMYVIKVNGQPVTPFWCDTLALPLGGTPSNPTSITFRSRFRDFTGPYVMHCHMLAHEDLGMMQGVTVT